MYYIYIYVLYILYIYVLYILYMYYIYMYYIYIFNIYIYIHTYKHGGNTICGNTMISWGFSHGNNKQQGIVKQNSGHSMGSDPQTMVEFPQDPAASMGAGIEELPQRHRDPSDWNPSGDPGTPSDGFVAVENQFWCAPKRAILWHLIGTSSIKQPFGGYLSGVDIIYTTIQVEITAETKKPLHFRIWRSLGISPIN